MVPWSRSWSQRQSPRSRSVLYSISQFALLLLSILAIGGLLILGRWPERFAGAALLLAMLLSPIVSALQVGDLRWGVALVSCGLATSLIYLSFVADRWWLLAAAGIQLISPITFALAATPLDVHVWAAVSIRLAVWFQLMLAALFGVLECRFAPYARPVLASKQ